MLSRDLYHAGACVAGIFPIAMIGNPESPPEWVEELAGDCYDTAADLFDEMAELTPFVSDDVGHLSDDELASEIAQAWVRAGRGGFVVRGEICVRTYDTTAQVSFHSSRSHYRLYCFYVDTIDAIEPRLLAYAEEQHAASRRQAGAA